MLVAVSMAEYNNNYTFFVLKKEWMINRRDTPVIFYIVLCEKNKKGFKCQ